MEKITFEDIQKASESIKTTDIRGKAYAEVNQRIKVFRMLHPLGRIETQLIEDTGERCTFKALAYTEKGDLLGTGHAFESKTASNINKTSYIENCETSAVGRCLAMCGIGIDTSIASFEEVDNAIKQQEVKEVDPPADDIMKEKVKAECKRCGMDLVTLKEAIKNVYPNFKLETMTVKEFMYLKAKFDKTPTKEG